MEGYKSYQAFLEDLAAWGDKAVLGKPEGWDLQKAFDVLWKREEEGVGRGVFSPFLYVVLGAGLGRGEALFLAAVLYWELCAAQSGLEREEGFSISFWEKFWNGREDFADELFYQADPLLFQRRQGREGEKTYVRMKGRVFLFLSKGILLEQRIPGMYWYSHSGGQLPYLGDRAKVHPRISQCIRQVQGKKVCCLHGREGSGRKLNYAYLAAEQGRGLIVARYEALESPGHLQEILLECLLRHGLLAIELPKEGAEGALELLDWMEGEETVFFLGEEEEYAFFAGKARQYLSFAIPFQEVLKDKKLYWEMTGEYLWESQEDRVEFLNRYTFLPGKLRGMLELGKAYARSDGREGILGQDLRQAALQWGGHSLQKYAKKVEGIYTMEDLILPAAQKEKLFHIINRVKNHKHVYEEWGFLAKSPYGNGVSMVFAGSPGTGKTMAAQAMASALGMELYRVELPSVVDKYIGEMEKKLNRIFEEAQKSMAVLFFDEADVLFGKRTEIKESNDRYSNMEVAFLLQKMEEYEGVSILATNYLQNFDEAFRRRISDIVDFPMPDAQSREKMWRTMIPPRLPVSEDMDYHFLGKQFEVTGSVIKNALLYGSFLAAESQEQRLTMDMALLGLAHELEKSGRKLGREDYGEYWPRGR